MNAVRGKARRKLKDQIAAAKYQQIKFGLSEAEELRLESLENEYKRKDSSGLANGKIHSGASRKDKQGIHSEGKNGNR